MELGVLLLAPLAGDVAPDLAFAAVLADRTEVGPVGPELPTPQELLDGGDPPEDLSGGGTLDDPGGVAGGVRGDRWHGGGRGGSGGCFFSYPQLTNTDRTRQAAGYRPSTNERRFFSGDGPQERIGDLSWTRGVRLMKRGFVFAIHGWVAL